MKTFATILAALLLPFTPCLLSAQFRYVPFVDPFIGSEGDGHIFIGPSCPYGMVKPGPDNSKASNSGYVPDMEKPLYGFSQVHVSGTGGGPKYGNITVMPFAGDFSSVKQESLRDKETTQAGYYSVLLPKWNIQTEITTTAKASFYRFRFQNHDQQKAVKIDAGDFLGEKAIPDSREAQMFVGSETEVLTDSSVRGYSRIRGGWNNGTAYTVYYYAVFSKPFSNFNTWQGDQLQAGKKLQTDAGAKTGAMLFFNNTPDELQLKIGISFISCAKAQQNAEKEITEWNFDKTLQQTQEQWEKLLSKIDIGADATREQKIMFYTALYHTMVMPVDRTGENPLWENNQPYYDDFYAIWDTYRSSHPLITLITPSRQVAIVNALLNIYQRDGYMPDARSGNCNGRTQGGSNAEVLIADAYAKGLPGINYSLALEAMLKDAEVPPGGNEEKEGRGGLTDYNSLGYVSTNYVRAGNRTIEYSYDDYCLAMVAKGLNRKGEYNRYIKQADNWQNLWRPISDHGANGFIMPKDAAGKWVDSFQCAVSNGRISYTPYDNPLAQDWPICVCWWCGFFYEASSWEYSLSVPHDVAALIRKSGGAAAFKNRLDTLFDNNFYNVGNEPSFLTPNLYHWINRPDLSSARIRQIIQKNYNSSRSGIPGNDDSGAMSSWLAFHMMGFYPNAGQSYYLINAPFIRQTIIHLENGKQFTVKANNFGEKNIFIRSATLNGKPYDLSWIEHKDIASGGELILEMGATPSSWGTQTPPPSKS